MRSDAEKINANGGWVLNRPIADYINSEIVPSGLNRNVRSWCPSCGPDRKKQNERTLSIKLNEDHALFLCHHCDEKGRVNFKGGSSVEYDYEFEETNVVSIDTPRREEKRVDYNGVTDDLMKWLTEERGISPETAESADLVTSDIWMRGKGEEVSCLGFRYNHSDGSTAVKWRDSEKNFSQTGAAKELWGIENFDGGAPVIRRVFRGIV